MISWDYLAQVTTMGEMGDKGGCLDPSYFTAAEEEHVKEMYWTDAKLAM